MTDAENNETSEQSPQDETPQDENASAAGPVAGEDTSSSQAAEDAPTPTPPAEDAPEAEEDSSAEAQAEEAPAAEDEGAGEEVTEQEADSSADAAAGDEAEASDGEPEPKTEKKKDVIPGADLEPIAVEPEAELSAEERARKEADEEEKARREAELAGDAEEPSAASRAPAKMESGARFLATGKRKHAIARVILTPGSGKIEVNRRSLEEFFPRPLHQTIASQPLVTTGYEGNVDVRIRVHGGGVSGQAGAIRHGIARALTEVDPELRGELKRRGFLTRDARVKERRKAGLKKARKRPQFSKR